METIMDDAARKEADSKVNAAWIAIQTFYLANAKVVITTCGSSGSQILRSFKPHLCLVDETSQFSEVECLAPFVTFYQSLSTIVLVGDHEQLKPTVTSMEMNEFGDQNALSLFQRLVVNGDVPRTMLRVQYRMHPSISRFPNDNFYGGKLFDHYSSQERGVGQMFEKWARKYRGCASGQRSIFVSVNDGQLLRETGGFSKINTVNAGVVRDIVNSMVTYGIPVKDVIVFSFYKAQVALIKRLLAVEGPQGIRVETVDSSQGSENAIVVIDVVTPGGEDGPMGFVKDPNRMNVSLTRARDGLVVVGKLDMAVKSFSTRGTSLWKKFTQHHRRPNRTLKRGWILLNG
jgi:regulator of nonsense transcripts 1